MISIGMIAVLLSVLTLGIRRISESFELRKAARVAVAEIRNAQAGALSHGVDYVVEFDTTTSGGPPGSFKVFRPGVQAGGTISAVSSGTDARSLDLIGISNGTVVSDVLFLNGTSPATGAVAFDWILEAEASSPDSCCTISISQGAATVATIPPSQIDAALPWTEIRAVSVPEWPRQVRMDAAGSTLPLCSTLGSPWTGSTNHCLRYRSLGSPESAGALLLCSDARVVARITISAGAGRVGVDRVGVCP
jgi:hypothetical protein